MSLYWYAIKMKLKLHMHSLIKALLKTEPFAANYTLYNVKHLLILEIQYNLVTIEHEFIFLIDKNHRTVRLT